jgi:hypothetical protein
MEYTLEQKALAAIRGDLWWRLPDGAHEDERTWSLLHEDVGCVELGDLQKPGFVYHIGPKAPPILSESEAEFCSILESLIPMFAEWHQEFPEHVGDKEHGALLAARVAVAKARGEA